MMDELIICPNDEKIMILNEYEKDNFLHQVKFMSKEEFISNYYFKWDARSIFYLMSKYNYNIDVCKVYLNNLYYIDINKKYSNKKLEFLKNLKLELINNNLLIFDSNFSIYFEKKSTSVRHYYNFDKYLDKIFNVNNNYELYNINSCVYELSSMEDEISFVCIKIRELLKNGIDINKIFLCNVSSDYYYMLEKIFSYYNIPVNIPYQDSIYSSKYVQDFIKTKELDLEDVSKSIINKKIIGVLEELLDLDSDNDIYNTILIDKLKHTYFSNILYNNAVNIKNLDDREFLDDEYVFVMGFNLDILPKSYKDIDYISDIDKDEVDLYKTSYLNIREKCVVSKLLSNIKNLTISYKLSSPFQKYYPSILVKELNLEVIRPNIKLYNYSHKYNKIKLGEMFDRYYVYGEVDRDLECLSNNYEIDYNTYKNIFSGINKKLYLDNIKKPLILSYTSLNSYHECKFKYYINYVLKIDDYQDTFQANIGSLYHKILSLYKRSDFNFEDEWNKYFRDRDLSLKEKVLLVKIKKELLELIDVLKKQQLLTGYDDEYLEKEFNVVLKKDVDVLFKGYIDKIMYLNKNNEFYYSIVDYKSGMIDTHIEPLKYGLNMQLPIYLYFINKSNIFNNPIFTGIYYQNILFQYPTWSLDIEKEKNNRYMLKGYSTDDVSVLSRFDSTYENSLYIKSMKYDAEKGFNRFSKLINNDLLKDMIDYTDHIINKSVDGILEGDFSINPKVYGKDNVSCNFCRFRDLCYTTPKDIEYLDKVLDLSFLGGDEE